MDLFAILGAEPSDDAAAIKRKYRKAAKGAHPDQGGSKERFGQLTLARDVLCDPKRRARYEQTGEAEETKADQTGVKARDIAMKAVLHVFDVCDQRGLPTETVDVIGDAVLTIGNWRKERCAALDKLRRDEKTFRARAKRFTAKKGKNNRMSAMLEAHANSLARNVPDVEAEIAGFDEAVRLLKEHDWDFTAQARPVGGSGLGIVFLTMGGT